MAWPRECDWCGEEIEKGSEVVFVVRAPDAGHKIDPSGPEAVFHTGTCYTEAAAHGWS